MARLGSKNEETEKMVFKTERAGRKTGTKISQIRPKDRIIQRNKWKQVNQAERRN
jgi:hypothetical protein